MQRKAVFCIDKIDKIYYTNPVDNDITASKEVNREIYIPYFSVFSCVTAAFDKLGRLRGEKTPPQLSQIFGRAHA